MNKLILTETDAIMKTLSDISLFLSETAAMYSFTTNKNGTTTAVYRINDNYISVAKDINNYTYSINFSLKPNATITGRIIDGNIIASSVPNDEIPFI